MTSICNLTLYDLMAEDFSVAVNKNSQYGYDLHIENYDCKAIEIDETEVSPQAMESFAEFCQKFLAKYNRVKGRLKNEL